MRILVVDDNEAWTLTLQTALQELGHTVCVAHDGMEGKAKLLTFSPDLILLDLVMPAADGKEFLDRKRESQRNVPVVLVTGYPLEAAKLVAERSDILGVIEKPCDMERLQKLLDVLEKRA